MGENGLHETQVGILEEIDLSGEEALTNSELAERTGKSGGNISHHTETLKEKGYIVDGHFKGNKNQWKLKESVEIDYNYTIGNFFAENLYFKIFSLQTIFFLLFILIMNNSFRTAAFLGFLVGIIPPLLVSMYVNLDETKIKKIDIQKE